MEENIYLESDEEITSVIDKVAGAMNPKVNLVVPRGATLLSSPVNLKLLKAEAERHKKEIAIITQDKVGRNFASQVGIPVFEDVKKTTPSKGAKHLEVQPDEIIELDMSREIKAELPKDVRIHHYQEQKAPHKLFIFAGGDRPKEFKQTEVKSPFPPSDKTEPPKPKSKYRVLKTIIILIILLVLFALSDLFFVRAAVRLTVPAEVYEKFTQILVDTTLPRSNINEGKIRGDVVLVESEKEKQFEATGTKETGEKAAGTLTIYNEAGVDQELPAGAKIRSDSGLNFTTDSAVTIPKAALSASGDKVLGKVQTSVTASEPGDNYNLSDATTYSVPDNDKLSVSGGTTGGTTKTIKVVSSEDINSARDALSVELAKELLSQLKQKAKELYVVDSAVSNEVISFTTDRKAGEEAEKFSAKAKIQTKVITFKDSEFREATVEMLSRDIPQGKELIVGTNDTVTPEYESVDWPKGELKLKSTLKAHLGGKVEKEGIAKAVRLKTAGRAQNYASKIAGVKAVRVEFQPSWVPKLLPLRVKNIEVKLDYQ